MALLIEGSNCIENIKLEEAVENKPNHIWKIADILFEGDVWENISDVNCASLIIHTNQ